MSEVKEIVTTPAVPEKREEKVAAILCDLCGRRGTPHASWELDPFSIDDGANVNRVSVHHERGDWYGNDRSTTDTEFHVCPACWTAKVVPWFESQGAKPTISERD